jgi:hypothetical protein
VAVKHCKKQAKRHKTEETREDSNSGLTRLTPGKKIWMKGRKGEKFVGRGVCDK